MASLGHLDIYLIRAFVMILINSNLESPGMKTEMGLILVSHLCIFINKVVFECLLMISV